MCGGRVSGPARSGRGGRQVSPRSLQAPTSASKPPSTMSFGLHTHLGPNHLMPTCFQAGKPRPVPLKRRLALGRSSWYPKETLVSCILVLASNSTPTCSWRAPGDAQGSASQARLPGTPAPGRPRPRSAPSQRVPGPAHLVAGFVVVGGMHACLAQRYRRQPVVHCKRVGGGRRKPRGRGACGRQDAGPGPNPCP